MVFLKYVVIYFKNENVLSASTLVMGIVIKILKSFAVTLNVLVKLCSSRYISIFLLNYPDAFLFVYKMLSILFITVYIQLQDSTFSLFL